MEFSTTPLLWAGGFLAVIAVALVIMGEIGVREIRRKERENGRDNG